MYIANLSVDDIGAMSVPSKAIKHENGTMICLGDGNGSHLFGVSSCLGIEFSYPRGVDGGNYRIERMRPLANDNQRLCIKKSRETRRDRAYIAYVTVGKPDEVYSLIFPSGGRENYLNDVRPLAMGVHNGVRTPHNPTGQKYAECIVELSEIMVLLKETADGTRVWYGLHPNDLRFITDTTSAEFGRPNIPNAHFTARLNAAFVLGDGTTIPRVNDTRPIKVFL